MNKIKILLFIILCSFHTSNEIKHFRIRFEEPPIFIKRKKIENKEKIANLQNFENDVGFHISGEIAVHNLILYRQEYLSLPAVLKNSVVSITITSENLNRLCGFNSPYKVKGCAISQSNEIYLDAVYRYGDLTHESIHIYSYQKDRVESELFQRAYEKEGNSVAIQNGNVQNVYEYFVSAYLLFMQNSRELLERAPLTYQYFISC